MCDNFFESEELLDSHKHPVPVYCALCDEYFKTKRARHRHNQRSEKHPKCIPCNMRFGSLRALHYHIAANATYKLVPGHFYCKLCDVAPRTAAGLRYHNEHEHPHGYDPRHINGPMIHDSNSDDDLKDVSVSDMNSFALLDCMGGRGVP